MTLSGVPSAAASAGASGRVSDIPQLDSVSEGDITLSPSAATPLPSPHSAPDAGDGGGDGPRDAARDSGRRDGRGDAAGDGGRHCREDAAGDGDSTVANHSRVTSTASGLPPDYENVISVSVHRAGPGVRAWRTYSDVGDSAHDYSVVTERAGRLEGSVSADGDGAAHRGDQRPARKGAGRFFEERCRRGDVGLEREREIRQQGCHLVFAHERDSAPRFGRTREILLTRDLERESAVVAPESGLETGHM